MSLLDQSGVTGEGLDPYNVHALFVNMDNMWTKRFGNYDCLINLHFETHEQSHPKSETLAQQNEPQSYKIDVKNKCLWKLLAITVYIPFLR